MGLISYVKNKIRHFLLQENPNPQITINQKNDFFAACAIYRIWYRGDSSELSELYAQLDVPSSYFWKARSTHGLEIRKLHTGLPKLTVNVLTNIIKHDYNGIEFTDREASAVHENTWAEIEKENSFCERVEDCVRNVLIVGDGAFKITFDKDISELPIIEFVSGENVDFVRNRGRVTEVVFNTEYSHRSRKYELKERYGKGYILYELYDSSGKQVPFDTIPQTEWISCGGWKFDSSVMLAVPVLYGCDERYEGRGESIFEAKTDCYDSLDECWSQWMDALRAGRTDTYIPENLIPRDEETGRLLTPNPFDNRFIAVASDMSSPESGKKIMREQSPIQHDSYLATYITALDLCLQGVISPSTLGIDTKKLDNAEAQREKEKTTLYTRGKLVEMLEKALPEVVISAVCAVQISKHEQAVKPDAVKVKFGEYANPSFESQVETIGKARAQGIMSIEASVDELYGDSRSQDWKKEETERLKAEQGISVQDETAVSDDGLL